MVTDLMRNKDGLLVACLFLKRFMEYFWELLFTPRDYEEVLTLKGFVKKGWNCLKYTPYRYSGSRREFSLLTRKCEEGR